MIAGAHIAPIPRPRAAGFFPFHEHHLADVIVPIEGNGHAEREAADTQPPLSCALRSRGGGTHHAIRQQERFIFTRTSEAERREALDELMRLSEEAGLYDADYRSLLTDPA